MRYGFSGSALPPAPVQSFPPDPELHRLEELSRRFTVFVRTPRFRRPLSGLSTYAGAGERCRGFPRKIRNPTPRDRAPYRYPKPHLAIPNARRRVSACGRSFAYRKRSSRAGIHSGSVSHARLCMQSGLGFALRVRQPAQQTTQNQVVAPDRRTVVSPEAEVVSARDRQVREGPKTFAQ